MKITMIGKSGSGKTTFMAGMYEVFGLGRVAGFYIAPTATDFKTSVIGMNEFDQLSFRNRNFNFPPGTTRTTSWLFDLVHNSRVVANFEWIDYRGGILEDIYNANLASDAKLQNQVNELMGHIVMSDAIILFADSILLSLYKTPAERANHTGANLINQIIRHYATYGHKKELTIVIALTKADSDSIPRSWKENDYSVLLNAGREVFHEVVSLCKLNAPGWVGCILPVGCIGEGNTESTIIPLSDFRKPIGVTTKIINYPQPMNLEHVLFFCLGCTLHRMRETSSQNAKQLEHLFNEAKRNQSFMNDVLSRMFGETSSRKQAEQYAAKLETEMALLRGVQPFIEPLFQVALKKVRTQ
jgi:hypothetical protein